MQPLIRCVLDGYNVAVLAYGQTGSGKTFTMSGPHPLKGSDTFGVRRNAQLKQFVNTIKRCTIKS
eukprot:1179064-Prorocentrum_minimum.AAC.2